MLPTVVLHQDFLTSIDQIATGKPSALVIHDVDIDLGSGEAPEVQVPPDVGFSWRCDPRADELGHLACSLYAVEMGLCDELPDLVRCGQLLCHQPVADLQEFSTTEDRGDVDERALRRRDRNAPDELGENGATISVEDDVGTRNLVAMIGREMHGRWWADSETAPSQAAVVTEDGAGRQRQACCGDRQLKRRLGISGAEDPA